MLRQRIYIGMDLIQSPKYHREAMTKNYAKAERISLRNHPEFSEDWLQKQIATDPKLLGLGDLIVVGQQRTHPRGGRLDMILQDPDTKRRYEVELQLGPTDESHIIRCVEYWDIEKHRYPQYEHCAVIVAEDILSRFLNVISLFNRAVPLIAIQVQAYKVGEHQTLIFTKVLDDMPRGVVDADEEALAAPANRQYWLDRTSSQSMQSVDELFDAVTEVVPNLKLNYTKTYIGVTRDEKVSNFILFTPRRTWTTFEPRIQRTDDLESELNSSGLTWNYDNSWNRYRVSFTRKDSVKDQVALVKKLTQVAFAEN